MLLKNIGMASEKLYRNTLTKETNFVERKHDKFKEAARKWEMPEMLAVTKVKMSGSEKKCTGNSCGISIIKRL